MKTKIYILCDPDGKIRYVGKTIKKYLSSRLTAHLWEARCGAKNHRCNWIRSILSKGYIPSISLIGEVKGNGCKEEIAWIKYFRDEGIKLVNGTDGGEGQHGVIVSKETREKRRIQATGKTASLSTRRKLRNIARNNPKQMIRWRKYWSGSRRKKDKDCS